MEINVHKLELITAKSWSVPELMVLFAKCTAHFGEDKTFPAMARF